MHCVIGLQLVPTDYMLACVHYNREVSGVRACICVCGLKVHSPPEAPSWEVHNEQCAREQPSHRYVMREVGREWERGDRSGRIVGG